MHDVVTGAGGFIGGHLVDRLLTEGHHVRAIDKKPGTYWWQRHDARACEHVIGKVSDIPAGEFRDATEVYHLAADMGGIGYITNNLVSCASNITETIHLLNSLKTDQRVFFSSSACVYPVHLQGRSDVVSLREDDVWPFDPEPGYGFEKLYGEMLMEYHRRERKLETRVARFHNVAGPHGSWNDGREKAPAAICRKVAVAKLTGELEIEVWGDGEQVRSYMYVDDCVEGILRIMNSARSEPFNLGSDYALSVNELIDMVEQIAGFTAGELKRIYLPTKPQGVRGRNSDNTFIKERLGWAPSIPMVEWMVPTYEWIYDQVKMAL